jgi:hypothetical protein
VARLDTWWLEVEPESPPAACGEADDADPAGTALGAPEHDAEVSIASEQQGYAAWVWLLLVAGLLAAYIWLWLCEQVLPWLRRRGHGCVLELSCVRLRQADIDLDAGLSWPGNRRHDDLHS